ncbi:hypothetical protein NECAME_14360 [Necator americanus]|uniref:G-protein coupled receptors family 1 profile domain-containing protein n=1 Tax=Necator americanus TaxID=51031 RepID=W2SQV0_NECAM|nr:hypothetical protein NECAME_14360 [Necator americanus]ETN71072.1 hypothetical protein NECAME_14360 [Necator americanus]
MNTTIRRLAATAPIVCYCIVWIVSIVVALPYSLTVRSKKIDTFGPWNDIQTPAMLSICGRSYPEICVEMQDTWDRAYISKTTFTITVLAIQYLLPLFALAYAYVQIGSTIRRRSKVSRTIDQARRMSMQSRNRTPALFRRALLLLMILVLTYAICWAPMNIHNVLNGFEVISYSQYRYLFCHLVGISSACVNPITYALVNESFRNALHHMFLSYRPCYVTSGDSTNSYITNSKPTKVTIRDPYSTKLDFPAKVDELEPLENSTL